jgi:hypothetical protein
LLILIKSSFEGSCQPIDTICIPVAKAKKLLGDSKLYKYTDSLLRISEAQLTEVKYQKGLIEEREVETIANYNRQIANLEKQVEIYKEQVRGFEQIVRRERRKRRLITGAGILTTGAALFLSLKK